MKRKLFTDDSDNVYVAGDLHGDYENFRKIIDLYNTASRDSLLIFLGDYADRGHSGVEIITGLNDLIAAGKRIVALKGNHEMYENGRPSFYPCHLMHEAQIKYGSWESFYHGIFGSFLEKLYIAAIINNVLLVHGGISSKIKTRDDLSKPSNEKILLWSDTSTSPGEYPNTRGAGVLFGEDITDNVLSSLGLALIVRSHEPKKAAEGPCIEHGGKVITTNSCNTYGENWKPFILKINTNNLEHETIFL